MVQAPVDLYPRGHGMVSRLLAAAFFLSACLAFANPFLGEWQCDQDFYLVTENHISGIMDGIPYETDYTYNDQVWVWKDRTWVYRFVDSERLLLVGILSNGEQFAPGYWLMSRFHRNIPEL